MPVPVAVLMALAENGCNQRGEDHKYEGVSQVSFHSHDFGVYINKDKNNRVWNLYHFYVVILTLQNRLIFFAFLPLSLKGVCKKINRNLLFSKNSLREGLEYNLIFDMDKFGILNNTWESG